MGIIVAAAVVCAGLVFVGEGPKKFGSGIKAGAHKVACLFKDCEAKPAKAPR